MLKTKTKLSLSFAHTLSNRLAAKSFEIMNESSQNIRYNVQSNFVDSVDMIQNNNKGLRNSAFESLDLFKRLTNLQFQIRDLLNNANVELGVSKNLAEINKNKTMADYLNRYIATVEQHYPDDKIQTLSEYIKNEVSLPKDSYMVTCLRTLDINALSTESQRLENEAHALRDATNKLNTSNYIELMIDDDIIDLMGIKVS